MREKLTKEEVEVLNRAFGAITQVHWGDLTEEHQNFCNEVVEPLHQKILRQFDIDDADKQPRIRIDWSEAGQDIKLMWIAENPVTNVHQLLGQLLIPVEFWPAFLGKFGTKFQEVSQIRLEKKG